MFLEEALFLGALPSDERFGAPESVLLSPNGDAEVLRSAKLAAADWDDAWGLVSAAGARLREQTPDEATDVRRGWDAVDVATRVTGTTLGFDPGIVEYWVQAEIVLPDDGEVAWTLGVAPSADGPWTGVMSGTHRSVDGNGAGTVTWDREATARALGADPPAPLGMVDATYEDIRADIGLRYVEATVTPVPGLAQPFVVVGDVELLYTTASLAVTTDGLAWPGGAAVWTEENGGRGEGVVLRDGVEELAFTACWDGVGHVVWQTGDDGIVPIGDPTACGIADPFD
ncbi:MAG: hypothetical protein ABMB14_03690 [Myxococcota bacterium]